MSASKSGLAVVVSALAVLSFAGAGGAGADANGWGINGTFLTSSNGDWAKINQRYENQPSVRSTWTIETKCISPTDCNGTVHSDAGWTAPIYTTNGLWFIKRAVDNWRYCEDGSPISGLQEYKLYPVAWDGTYDKTADEFTGVDKTTGPSGSCGRNQWPTVEMPFYMKRA